MDRTDLEILRVLKENARARATATAERVNLSVSAVIERIRRLEASGTIRAFTVLVDEKRLGLDITALMEVSLEHPRYYDDFCEKIRSNPYIVECYYLTGEFDFMLKIYTESSDSLERIHRDIKSMKGVQATRTHFVLKTVKNDVAPIPEDAKHDT